MPPPAKIKKVEDVFEELIKSMKAPVEFDLPSALKEWKLGYYIPIKRNVYLTKRRVEDDGIFCSCTPSSGSSVACDKDCQCGMLFSCCSSNCKCDNQCANKSFQHRPLKKTKLITAKTTDKKAATGPSGSGHQSKKPHQWTGLTGYTSGNLGVRSPSLSDIETQRPPKKPKSTKFPAKKGQKLTEQSAKSSPRESAFVETEKCGFGLVAEDEIKKGEFVIEYVGEVIDDRTCEERLWKMKRQRDTNFYLCEVNSNMVIDATNKGNMSRFINHSCDPNTEMQKWTVDGETRVGIFALRDIKDGEELTYDYKFVQFGADQDCHCGSSNCRKMLGTTKSVNSIVLHNGNSGSSQDQHVVKKKRKTTSENCIGQFIRLWLRQDKMYVAAVIYGFNEYTKLHTLMFDVDVTEEFDLREEDWDFLPGPDDPDE